MFGASGLAGLVTIDDMLAYVLSVTAPLLCQHCDVEGLLPLWVWVEGLESERISVRLLLGPRRQTRGAGISSISTSGSSSSS
jgi:hypothetical protein